MVSVNLFNCWTVSGLRYVCRIINVRINSAVQHTRVLPSILYRNSQQETDPFLVYYTRRQVSPPSSDVKFLRHHQTSLFSAITRRQVSPPSPDSWSKQLTGYLCHQQGNWYRQHGSYQRRDDWRTQHLSNISILLVRTRFLAATERQARPTVVKLEKVLWVDSLVCRWLLVSQQSCV